MGGDYRIPLPCILFLEEEMEWQLYGEEWGTCGCVLQH